MLYLSSICAFLELPELQVLHVSLWEIKDVFKQFALLGDRENCFQVYLNSAILQACL